LYHAAGGIPSQPSAPAVPDVNIDTVASVSGNQTLQSGVATTDQASNIKGQAQIAYDDPSAAAKGQAQMEVDGAVAAETPESVTTARGDVEGGVAAYQDPAGAARNEATGMVDEEVQSKLPGAPVPNADGNVSASVTVTSPKPDGTK